MKINLESQLEKSNQIKNHIVSSASKLSSEEYNWKSHPKKWSVQEVIKHLSLVYDKYLDNFEKAIESAPDFHSDERTKTQRTIMGRLSIYSMKPKGNKRSFKMKTFDFFTPLVENENIDSTISEFLDKKEKFNTLLKRARLKNLKNIKMPTSLGEKMKFYVPECFEFIIAHEERHLIQIDEIFLELKKNAN